MAARQHERSSSGRDARAALAAAGGQNRPAGTGLHAVPETVLAGTAAVVRLESTLAHVNNSVGGGPGGPWVSLQTADYRGSFRPTASGWAAPTEPTHTRTQQASSTLRGRLGRVKPAGPRPEGVHPHGTTRIRSVIRGLTQNPPIQRRLVPAAGSDTPMKQDLSWLPVAAGVTRLLRSVLPVTASPAPSSLSTAVHTVVDNFCRAVVRGGTLRTTRRVGRSAQRGARWLWRIPNQIWRTSGTP